ncbi:hypothetical protein V3481_006582 [Fusarium oxysporum f. sp. vasinfectum]
MQNSQIFYSTWQFETALASLLPTRKAAVRRTRPASWSSRRMSARMGSLPVDLANEGSFKWPPDHLLPRIMHAQKAKPVAGSLPGMASDQQTSDKQGEDQSHGSIQQIVFPKPHLSAHPLSSLPMA